MGAGLDGKTKDFAFPPVQKRRDVFSLATCAVVPALYLKEHELVLEH